jgi:hypothetical protein
LNVRLTANFRLSYGAPPLCPSLTERIVLVLAKRTYSDDRYAHLQDMALRGIRL